MSKSSNYPKEFRRAQIRIQNDRCFVLMPFHKMHDNIYATIADVLSEYNILCLRDDQVPGNQPFMNKVMHEILGSRYIIVILSDYEPNVIYELGIAHSFKDIQNVLVLIEKDPNDKCAVYRDFADITNITYHEYNKSNLFSIKEKVRSFVEFSKLSSSFRDGLIAKNILTNITECNNEIIEELEQELQDINMIADVLTGNKYNFIEKDYSLMLGSITNCLSQSLKGNKEDLSIALLLILAHVCISGSNYNKVASEVDNIISNYFNAFSLHSRDILKYKTLFVLTLAYNGKFLNICMEWTIKYLGESKSTTIDLNRYDIEKFLMSRNIAQVDNYIIEALKSNNAYVREHMADIIGEKPIHHAYDSLCLALESEANCYAVISLIAAIGKLKKEGAASLLLNWLDKQSIEKLAENNGLILNHTARAIRNLDASLHENNLSVFLMKWEPYMIDKRYL